MGFAMCRLLDPYTPGGEPIHNGSRLVSLPRNHTHQDRLRDDFERTHTHLRPLGDYTTFGAPVPGRPQITIIVIWAFFTQDVTSLA